MAMHLGGRKVFSTMGSPGDPWVPVLYRSGPRCCKKISLSYISHIFMRGSLKDLVSFRWVCVFGQLVVVVVVVVVLVLVLVLVVVVVVVVVC